MNSSDRRVGQYAGLSKVERVTFRRQRFLEAGFQLFGTIGYNHTTIRKLCREAGLIDRYFYESFDSIETLLICVGEEQSRQLIAQIQQAVLETMPVSIEGAIRNGLTAFYTAVMDKRVARICYIEGAGTSARMDKALLTGKLLFADMILKLTETQFQLNKLSDEQKRLIAMGIGGSVNQIAVYWLMSDYKDTLEDVVGSALFIIKSLIPQANTL